MRKVFLTTTILLTASTALAFGGVFNHGSKSSTYKGGVDAIGVHINGKDKANIDIRTCDSETEELVGSECCKKTLVYNDNGVSKCCSIEGYIVQDGKCKKQCAEGLVLNEETNECCSEELNHCCPVGQTPYDRPYPPFHFCCEGEVFCSSLDAEGNCIGGGYPICCENGKKISKITSNQTINRCCPEDSTILDDDLDCCGHDGTFLLETNSGKICCPAGSTDYDDFAGCCGYDGTFLLTNTERDEIYCCPAGTTGFDEDSNCCGYDGTIFIEDERGMPHCCPIGSTGFTRYDYECCEPGTKPVSGNDAEMHCCPDSATSYVDGECI